MHPFQKHFADQPSSSDKISHHGYQRVYPWFLAHFVDRDVDLLEIGIDRTKSLELWKHYFRKVQICGIDLEEKAFPGEDVRLFKVDQSKAAELRKFREEVGSEFDIIIDDGSHVPSHQMLTLNELWSLLRPGGVYIVEDIETSYWGKSEIYGYQFDSRKENTVTFATQMIDQVNSEFRRPDKMKRTLDSPVANDVELVAFAHNCVVIIKKDAASFGCFYNRPYALSGSINHHSPWRRIRRWLSPWLKSKRK